TRVKDLGKPVYVVQRGCRPPELLNSRHRLACGGHPATKIGRDFAKRKTSGDEVRCRSVAVFGGMASIEAGPLWNLPRLRGTIVSVAIRFVVAVGFVVHALVGLWDREL